MKVVDEVLCRFAKGPSPYLSVCQKTVGSLFFCRCCWRNSIHNNQRAWQRRLFWYLPL